MNMRDRQLMGLVILLGVLVTINVLIYWLAICGTLYKRGARFPTGLLFWRFFHEMRVYEEICRARGRPLTFYHFCFILTWFNLLLALVTALLAIWDKTNPMR